MIKVGIIGGSGLDNPDIIKQSYKSNLYNTPYGSPSSKLTCGKIDGVDVVLLARHGINHEIYPSKVNFKANIQALKEEGCTHIIATGAVGSLKEEIKPGDLVFPDQFIDFTKSRESTYFTEYGNVMHQPMAEPFSKELRNILIEECETLGFDFHRTSTIVVIEGPRFSTKAESLMFKNYADIIGMTTFPEVALANELGIPYVNISMSTDYDCWKEEEESVTQEMVFQTMKENADKVTKLLINVIPKING